MGLGCGLRRAEYVLNGCWAHTAKRNVQHPGNVLVLVSIRKKIPSSFHSTECVDSLLASLSRRWVYRISLLGALTED